MLSQYKRQCNRRSFIDGAALEFEFIVRYIVPPVFFSD